MDELRSNALSEAGYTPSEAIAINERENDGFTYCKTRPSKEHIKELKEQKQRRRFSLFKDPEPYKTFLSEDLEQLQGMRGARREEFIKQIADKFIYFLNKSNRLGFSREILNSQFPLTIEERTRERISKAIIDLLINNNKAKPQTILKQHYRFRNQQTLSKGIVTICTNSYNKEYYKSEAEIYLLI